MWLSTIELVFLITVELIAGCGGVTLASPVVSGGGPLACTTDSLPSDIQNQLKSNFGSWTIQRSEFLSEHARKTWGGKTLSSCPGIAVGLFENAKTTYAFLLVPLGQPDSAYRFVVFKRKPGLPSYDITMVERSDQLGASNYFIRKISIGELFDEKSKRQFQVQSSEGVLMVDSSEHEYEADVYFWSNGHYRHEPVDR